MANQPGYTTPQKSNSAGDSDGMNYQQNQISGTGYGPNFFGSASAPQPPSRPSMQSAAGQLLQSQVNPMFGGQEPVTTEGMTMAAPQQQVTSGGGSFATKEGSLYKASDQDAPMPGDPIYDQSSYPSGKTVESYFHNKSTGEGFVVFSDGSTYDYNKLTGADQAKVSSYGGPRRLTPAEASTYFFQQRIDQLAPGQNPFQAQADILAMQDPTRQIYDERDSQFRAMGRLRDEALLGARAQQRLTGRGGFAGADVGGISAKFGQSAGDLGITAADAARKAIEDQGAAIFNLEQQATGEDTRIKKANQGVADTALNNLTIEAQNMATVTGKPYTVNPNLMSELNTLSTLALTRIIDEEEFASLVNQTMAKYGNGAFLLLDLDQDNPYAVGAYIQPGQLTSK